MMHDIVKLQNDYLEKFESAKAKQAANIKASKEMACKYIKPIIISSKHFEQSIFESSCEPASFYKEYFNRFFTSDLYTKYSSERNIKLNTGSLDENQFPLPEALKYCIEFALLKNWYGYSSSVGRDSAREALADYENALCGFDCYTKENVCVTLGVTQTLSSIINFISTKKTSSFSGITHIPNYMPFANTCENAGKLKWYCLNKKGQIKAEELIKLIDDTTEYIFITSDLNPLGCIVNQREFNLISEYCSKNQIYLIYDKAGAQYSEENKKPITYDVSKNEYLIVIDSYSKKLSIPGMKVGYFLASKSFVNGYYEYASTNYGGPASLFYLLVELEAKFSLYIKQGKKNITELEVKDFDHTYFFSCSFLQSLYDNYLNTIQYNHNMIINQRSIAISMLQELYPKHILEIIIPNTGLNIFVRINTDEDNYKIFEKILSENRVAVFPGVCCGVDSECWVRITIGVGLDELIEGLTRFISFFKKAPKEINKKGKDTSVQCS